MFVLFVDVQTLGSELIIGLVQAVDSEKDPRNLILVFNLVNTVARNFDLSEFKSCNIQSRVTRNCVKYSLASCSQASGTYDISTSKTLITSNRECSFINISVCARLSFNFSAYVVVFFSVHLPFDVQFVNFH